MSYTISWGKVYNNVKSLFITAVMLFLIGAALIGAFSESNVAFPPGAILAVYVVGFSISLTALYITVRVASAAWYTGKRNNETKQQEAI